MIYLVVFCEFIKCAFGLYFVYHEETKTYLDARSECHLSGLDLVVLKSQDEIQLINEFLLNMTIRSQHIWIGLDKLNDKSNFTWLDNREISDDNWEDGEPDGWNYQHCVCIQKQNNRWNSRTCGTKFHFICGPIDYDIGGLLFGGPTYLVSKDTNIMSSSSQVIQTKGKLKCSRLCLRHGDCIYFSVTETTCRIHTDAKQNSIFSEPGTDLWRRRLR